MTAAAWPAWTTPRTPSTRPWSAPYSPRAAAGAPVSAPIEWDELDDPSLRPDSFTVRYFPRRLAERGDPFLTVLTAQQVLPPIT